MPENARRPAMADEPNLMLPDLREALIDIIADALVASYLRDHGGLPKIPEGPPRRANRERV